MERDTYIKITDDVDEDISPSESDLMLDNYSDEEYSTPYTDNYDDVLNVGGMVEGCGTIFDDR